MKLAKFLLDRKWNSRKNLIATAVLLCCFLQFLNAEKVTLDPYTLDLAKLRYQQLLGIELEKKMGLTPQRYFHAWSRMHPEIHQINFNLVSPKRINTINEARVEIVKVASIVFESLNDDTSGISHFLLVKPFPLNQVNIDLDFDFNFLTEEGMCSASLNWGTIHYYYPHGRYYTEKFEEALAKLKDEKE
jgi:hypothetical protein